MSGTIAVLFVLLFFFLLQPQGAVEVYFSPGGGIEDLIIGRIKEAREKIDVAMYAFTSKEIAWALIRAGKRGVKARVILDGSFINNEYSKGGLLYDRGIDVRVDGNSLKEKGRISGKLHHKFAVIDNKIVITGSYNWTASAERRNRENLLVFSKFSSLVNKYSHEFDKIWKEGILYCDVGKEKLPADFPVISASDKKALKKHAKMTVKVRGAVKKVYHSLRSNTYFLHFGSDRSSFSAVIFNSAAEKFFEQGFDPEAYQGKETELIGQVIDHPKYGLEMILEDPSQVEILEEKKD